MYMYMYMYIPAGIHDDGMMAQGSRRPTTANFIKKEERTIIVKQHIISYEL